MAPMAWALILVFTKSLTDIALGINAPILVGRLIAPPICFVSAAACGPICANADDNPPAACVTALTTPPTGIFVKLPVDSCCLNMSCAAASFRSEGPCTSNTSPLGAVNLKLLMSCSCCYLNNANILWYRFSSRRRCRNTVSETHASRYAFVMERIRLMCRSTSHNAF